MSQQVGPVTGIGQRRTAVHIPYRSKVCEHTWTDHPLKYPPANAGRRLEQLKPPHSLS